MKQTTETAANSPVPASPAGPRSAAAVVRLLAIGVAVEALAPRRRRLKPFERWQTGTPPKRARRR